MINITDSELYYMLSFMGIRLTNHDHICNKITNFLTKKRYFNSGFKVERLAVLVGSDPQTIIYIFATKNGYSLYQAYEMLLMHASDRKAIE